MVTILVLAATACTEFALAWFGVQRNAATQARTDIAAYRLAARMAGKRAYGRGGK
jgi:hypothetical protein